MSRQAAERNALHLESYDFDLTKFIEAHSESTVGYGSEFRSVAELKPLLGSHPNFPKLKSLLEEGMHYVFAREINEETKKVELATLVSRGNHKSATEESDRIKKLLAKDVTHGFSIPLPAEVVHRLPGAAVQPLGIVAQWTVQNDGTRKIKHRLTQDLS